VRKLLDVIPSAHKLRPLMLLTLSSVDAGAGSSDTCGPGVGSVKNVAVTAAMASFDRAIKPVLVDAVVRVLVRSASPP